MIIIVPLQRIPACFVEELAQPLPSTCIISLAEKLIWEVEVGYNGGDLCFNRGWGVFASDIGIKRGDFIVFTYFGEGFFRVRRFLQNGCLALYENNEESDVLEEETYVVGNPKFTIELQKSHIEKCLNLPIRFWNEHVGSNSDKVDATLIVGDQHWDVSVTNNGNKIRLQRGWKQFMKCNNLQVGMRCMFELVSTDHIQFRVTIDP